ncbi:AcvB/VirJ family lysyl-phosphatidylglycerol hydrolase [Microvirga vignae]|uniref:AcvB/VirJ family lysyl-phosphatidylglycerol hydrolase n=1 Tax=Microvirga vignae TaxID=1225564 RepID=UPI00069AFBE5|nr:AcvB/VirJ family lysyl-phosphatidylglycerol hydrolase [Microvirga vignae]
MKATITFRGLIIVAALSTLALGGVLLGRSTWSAVATPSISTASIEIDEFGTVDVVRSDRPARGLVILVEDAPHAQTRQQDAIALAKSGLIAVSFNFENFRAELAKSPPSDECHYVSDDMKDLAQAVQRKLGLQHYFFPVLAGRGDGSAFAYAALAQAPANTLGGAISIGFQPVLRSDRTYCFDPWLDPAGDGLFALPSEEDLPGPWRVIAPESERQRVEAFQKPEENAEFVPAQDDASTRQALVESASQLSQTGEHGYSQLPVSIIKPDGRVKGLALIVSGDGGWRDIDKSIGEWLADRGIAVVGMDSLRYFWSKRSPGEVAADLALLLNHYGTEFATNHYTIIGYSFGADIMPNVWPMLPKSVKDRVSLVSLLGLGTNADFEVTVEGFVGAASTESAPLPPLLAQLPLERTQCIYGKDEAEDNETSCTAPELGQAQRIALEGGHHFDGDYTKAAEAIWARLQNVSPEL